MMKILVFLIFCGSTIYAQPSKVDFRSCLNDQIYAQNKIPENLDITRDLDDPTLSFETDQWISFNEYDSEKHYVLTDDSYNLTLHRLRSKQRGGKNHNTPVFLQHGLLSSSMDWVLAGPNKSLGFLLADQGYDVWLGNTRGNRYSRGHKYLHAQSEKYWNFSWHEMGVNDLPSMIDYVLEKTNHKKLFYIGHSQGTTNFFVMASQRPEYNEKIVHMFALAPVVFCDHMPSIIFQTLAKLDKTNKVTEIKEYLGINEFRPTNHFISKFVSWLCDLNYGSELCSNVMFMFVGFNRKQFDQTLLGRIIYNFPSGASVKQLLHYAKLINTGGFHTYDNQENYNLTKVTTPVTLFSSKNDLLSSNEDVQRLGNKLPKTVNNHLVEDDSFNHSDYLWGKNAGDMVYSKIVRLMNGYLPPTKNSNLWETIKNHITGIFA